MDDITLQTFKNISMDTYPKKEVLEPETSNEPVYVFEVFEDFEYGDEVLVESSPPASPVMAARLAQPHQGGSAVRAGEGGAGGGSPGTAPSVRELIVIPELANSIHIHHAMQQVSSTVVEVNGENSSGQSSPTTEPQHTYITVAMPEAWNVGDEIKVELDSDIESEGGNGVNYHVQYVEPQEIYTPNGHQPHMDPIRTYPVYGVTTVANGGAAEGASAESAWAAAGGNSADYTAYGVVVGGEEAEAPVSPARGAGGAAAGVGGGAPAAGGVPPRMPPATVQWLLDNYETAEGVSLPRSTLYAHYLRHCAMHRLDPVNAASFGKLIRSVFIGLRTRRLGTRGNSKYHYYGIRAKASATQTPPQSDSAEEKTDVGEQQDGRSREALESPVSACQPAHRQYLGAVSAPDPPELLIDDLPQDIPPEALQALRRHHREHGVEFLEAVACLDTAGVERARRAFWRRPPPALCRRDLLTLASRRDVAHWLRNAELNLYQKAVELLLPDVLRPIPPQLTQSIRNFAKSLESALSAGAGGAPAACARAQASAASALAAALRRYTSLNHLAQAARAVLTNHHQIQQMVMDLNRVDFRVVREQAAWACACAEPAAVRRLEADFKATLGRGASLEQWAVWLERCVSNALQPHQNRPDYAHRARRLLLDWSFYSSLVIRELTLRSAASFGSFHLLRLLYDEYVSYLIERRLAHHSAQPPIAVMHIQREEDEENSEEGGGSNTGEDEGDGDGSGEGDGDGEGEGEGEDGDWEWADEEEDDPPPAKRARTHLQHGTPTESIIDWQEKVKRR